MCGKCRDRAEERRRGVNPDYEDVQTQMANLASGNMQMQEGLGNISVEDSKFLGGDLKHTHLVKGLDYALLQKVCCHPILQPAIRCFSTCCYPPQSAIEDLLKASMTQSGICR